MSADYKPGEMPPRPAEFKGWSPSPYCPHFIEKLLLAVIDAHPLQRYIPTALPLSNPLDETEPDFQVTESSTSEDNKPRSSKRAAIAKIKRALGAIPADDHSMWITVGLATKHELGDDGYALWRHWSATSQKFTDDECRRRWKTLKPNGAVGLRTLVQIAEDNEPPPKELTDFIISASELVAMKIEPRDAIISPFMMTHSLMMIYAERGLGKTWFALTLAVAIATGREFISYEVSKAWIVLYIDGEMALADLQERLRTLATQPPDNLYLLPSERVVREDRPLNIHEPEDQERIQHALREMEKQGRRPTVIIFDNLSSLSGGHDENDNSALDGLLRWFIELRHMGYAVVLVHHAGKNGTQRGASRREDLLDTSIALKKIDEAADKQSGAHFTLEFPKTRGKTPQPSTQELRLVENRDGRLEWASASVGNVAIERAIIRALATRRYAKQKDLAAAIGKSASRVSQVLPKMRANDLVQGDPPRLTRAGRARALELFPELEAAILKQGSLLNNDDDIL